MEKDLVIISGRNEDAVGKPLIYATSKSFMDYFGINSAAELPKISEVFQEEIARAQDVNQLIEDQHALAETQEHTSEEAVESVVTGEIAETEVVENISVEENTDKQEDNKQEENNEEAL